MDEPSNGADLSRSLEKSLSANYISLREGKRVVKGCVHVGTRSEMDNAVNGVLAQRTVNIRETADIPFDKMEVGKVLNGAEVVHRRAVPEIVEAYDHVSVSVGLDQATNEPSPAEKCAAVRK